jgi:L-ribulose-5-phosphate 3-epimerase
MAPSSWGPAMKKGINGWTFPVGTSLLQAARAARAAGFEAFEPALEQEGELTPQSDEEQCRALGSRIRGLGLELGSLACGLHWRRPFSSPDPQVRREARNLALAALDRARWLGAPVLIVVPGVVAHFSQPQRLLCTYEDALARAFDALRELSIEAEARGVIIAIENARNQFLLSPVEMRDLIDRMNSGWIGACLDIGNALRFGVPQDWIQTLGRRIVGVHAKDFRLADGAANGFCPPGEGDVDWPAVMNALQRVRYQGPLTYEGQGELEDIAQRIDHIRAMATQPEAPSPGSSASWPPSADGGAPESRSAPGLEP